MDYLFYHENQLLEGGIINNQLDHIKVLKTKICCLCMQAINLDIYLPHQFSTLCSIIYKVKCKYLDIQCRKLQLFCLLQFSEALILGLSFSPHEMKQIQFLYYNLLYHKVHSNSKAFRQDQYRLKCPLFIFH